MGTVLLSAFLILKKYLANFQKGYLAVMSVFGGFWVSSLFNFSIWSAWWQMVFVVVSTIILANSNFHNRNSETDGQ